MWARVKGRTENELLRLPGLGAAYMFRPGFIQPRHGISSKTTLYNNIYKVTGWLLPMLPGSIVTTTEKLGKAFVKVRWGDKDGATALHYTGTNRLQSCKAMQR